MPELTWSMVYCSGLAVVCATGTPLQSNWMPVTVPSGSEASTRMGRSSEASRVVPVGGETVTTGGWSLGVASIR